MKHKICAILVMFSCLCYCVEVHFETSDSGFFLKHSRQPPVAPEISNVQPTSTANLVKRRSYDFLLSVDRFTVVQTTQPVSIRASYGPFSTKQTVPARFIVPDVLENQVEYLNNTTAALLELQQTNLHLDISAHLVRSIIPQDSPVLRVLFHAGADPGGHLQRQKLCVLLHVSMGTETPLKGRCMPEGEDGVCVAEVVIPSYWWPTLTSLINEKADFPQKAPQRWVQVSYSVFEPPSRNPEQCEPKIQIQPLTSFAQVPLMPSYNPLKTVRLDEYITLLIPQHAMYPMSKMHVLVFLQLHTDQKIAVFTLRARVKSGIKIIGATSSTEFWNISFEKENQKYTTARVIAVKNDKDLTDDGKEDEKENGVIEVFSWNLEVTNDAKEAFDGGKIVWSISYVYDNSNIKDDSEKIGHTNEETKKKFISKFEINKDDIQAVLPMAKNWELMNTAVLTGRQVAQAMKVFIVSQAGKVADVTLQSSCHAEDESVIKVSSSCSSVYVDGSEIRGSSNATIIVKYGTYVGVAKFVVWMPEFPLEVYISDFRLSQIKGWRVLDENILLNGKQTSRRKKRSYLWGQHTSGYTNSFGGDKAICRARYQQSPVEIYARFLAIDQNSGRISYFISRRTGLRITDLVQPLLRVADPKIAILKGQILQGKSMGRTDVQVLSPITGRVIGAKEIRVGSDKVSLSKLIVRVVSGLQLTITPDNTIENGYISETSVTHKLTAQYQEGLLDIDLEFSDGSRTPLREISVEDYFLLVESLDTEVVAFAPMLASHHPRVIAVGEGNGDLLRVTLLLSEDCRVRRNVLAKQTKASFPLASALASVQVDFNNGDNNNKHESVQNDGTIGRERKNYRNGDLSDIIVGIPLRETNRFHEPTVQAHQHRGKINQFSTDQFHGKIAGHNDLTSIETGMYVLLTAFCFAIIVFVISCVVYASKFRPVEMANGISNSDVHKSNFKANGIFSDTKFSKESTTNAHDWVWLGRSTMDRTSAVCRNSSDHASNIYRDSDIRITSNPMLQYSNPSYNPNNDVAYLDTYLNDNGICNPHTHVHRIACNENISIKPLYITSNGSAMNYRPPIPPHRNVGLQSNTDNDEAHATKNQSILSGREINYQRQKIIESTKLIVDVPNESDVISTPNNAITKVISSSQQPNKSENAQQAVSQLVSTDISQPISSDIFKTNELHNAEKLVKSSSHLKKNVFQFDSLTTNKIPPLSQKNTSFNNGENPDNTQLSKVQCTKKKLKPNAEENCDYVPYKQGYSKARRQRAKRATVVGNPMFSSTTNEESGPEECLNLDDLEMNYEEIMHYFDNLKESNA